MFCRYNKKIATRQCSILIFATTMQVSPHEFLQAVMKVSKKRFRIGAQSDPVEFLSWLLNTLHANLKSSKKNTSIIYQCFQVTYPIYIFNTSHILGLRFWHCFWCSYSISH